MMDVEANQKCARPAGRPRCETAHVSILDTAFRLLRKHPVADISILQIAREAGVSTATVYRWWSTKEELLLDAFLQTAEREKALDAHGLPLERLKRHILKTGVFFTGKDGIVVVRIITAIQDNPTLRKEFLKRVYSPHDQEIRAIVNEAIKRGDLPPTLNISTFLDSIFGPLLVRLLIRHESISEEFVATVFDQVVAGSIAYATT